MSKHHVTCKHPRASENINGVSFKKHGEHMRTVEPVESDVAKQFEGCPDFEVSAVIGERSEKKPRKGATATPPSDAPATAVTEGSDGAEGGDENEGDGGDGDAVEGSSGDGDQDPGSLL